MRICIFGAGAVGSHIAVRLALAGHDVSCVMRGPHLEAVKDRPDTSYRRTELSARVKASDDRPRWARRISSSAAESNGGKQPRHGLRPLLSDITCGVRAERDSWWYDLGLSPIIRRRRTSAFSIPAGVTLGGFPRPDHRRCDFSPNEVVEPGVVKNLSPIGTCCRSANAMTGRLGGLNGCEPYSMKPGFQSPPVPR